MLPFSVVYVKQGRIVISRFSTYEEAQNSFDALPAEANARVLHQCEKHGLADYVGYCCDCLDDHFEGIRL